MEWLKKLKAVFNIEFNEPIISIQITNKSNNIADNKLGCSYNKDRVELILYENAINDKKSQLKTIIKEYIKDDNLLLKKSTEETLKNLCEYKKQQKNSKILEFFKSIISETDYLCLETSLFLKQTFDEHRDVKKLKHDVRKKFGERGNNISNLCTAGYFDGLLMPLYNSVEKKTFQELYELIVSNAILAVFVHKSMTAQDIGKQIKNKIDISKRYSIRFVYVHGIGSSNVEKIKDFIEKYKESLNFEYKIILDKDNIIIVEFLL